MKEDLERKMFDAFALLLLLSHRFEYIADNELQKDGLTSKQFLTLAAIERGFDHAPSISEVAASLSTTHQNIKQIALQLKKKGFIRIEKDPGDRRRWALKVTEKNREYWDSRAEIHGELVRSFFSSLSGNETKNFHALISKLLANTDSIYRNARGT